ncbi:MAG: T9SS type A sorting domain-containing protein [Bacteroidetes bacterium]|nr:T9SS type A sorting domain-containing protein [Bacteroidota bacterium]
MVLAVDIANGEINYKKRLGGQCPDIPTFITSSKYNNDIYVGIFSAGDCSVDSPANFFGCHLNNNGTASSIALKLGYWPTNITEITTDTKYLKIYPNPTHDKNDKLTIQLINDEGKLIYKTELQANQNKMSIRTNEWKKGRYFIKYEYNGNKNAEQIIIH